MAKWVQRPLDFPLQFNPYQDAFWKAQKSRICRNCKIEFEAETSNECPQCKQKGVRKFHRLSLISGRRGGKTRAASIAAVQEAMIPNTIGWCCAPTFPKLHRYVIPAMEQLVPAEWVASWNVEFGDLRLKNGSLIHFQTLEHPDQGRGQGLDWLWMDEASELTEEHWHVIRPSLTERRGAAFFSTSPRSFDWVYDNLYKPAEDGMAGFWACRYSTSENPIISAEELAEAKATMPAKMYAQEYEADFVTFTGAVYGDDIRPSHLLTTDDAIRQFIPEWPRINADRPVLVGIDTGADHPFGAVKLVSTDKGMVVVGEYLERERSFVKHAMELRLLATNHVPPDVVVKPRYGINKNDKQASIELAQHGIYPMKAENDVVAGTERVKSWLHTGMLAFAVNYCPRTVRQMQSYRWDENKSADGQKSAKEKVFKKHDELPDALRYALMTWPILPKPPVKVDIRDISGLSEHDQATIRRQRALESALAPGEADPNDITGEFWT